MCFLGCNDDSMWCMRRTISYKSNATTPTIAKGEDQRALKVMGHRPTGVGALRTLAFVLIIGEAERFECGKQIAAF